MNLNTNDNQSETDFTLMHIFMEIPFLWKKNNSWSIPYDLLSIFGNLCGIVIGASIISIAEILWYTTGKFGTIWANRNKVDPKNPSSVFTIDRFHDRKFAAAQQKSKEGFLY